MPGFFGRKSVLATLRKQFRTGKVVTGTLKVRIVGSADQFTNVSWNYLYVHPQTEVSGYEGKGYADIDGMITAYRTSESDAPRVDDQWVIGTKTYLIKSVTPRLNADDSLGIAVYDCNVTSD